MIVSQNHYLNKIIDVHPLEYMHIPTWTLCPGAPTILKTQVRFRLPPLPNMNTSLGVVRALSCRGCSSQEQDRSQEIPLSQTGLLPADSGIPWGDSSLSPAWPVFTTYHRKSPQTEHETVSQQQTRTRSGPPIPAWGEGVRGGCILYTVDWTLWLSKHRIWKPPENQGSHVKKILHMGDKDSLDVCG